MKQPTPQEIADAIAKFCADRPADLRAAIAAAIQVERTQQRWATASDEDEDDDATPWITPCVIDGEPGYHVLFGDVVVDWTPHEDSAYHTIGDLIRRYGSAERVRLAVLSEETEAEAADADDEPTNLVGRVRKVLAA
ncbi:MAG TPA: hypothetical protein VGE07_29735 [Herpetosiphonaceae bacterium]